MAFLDLSELEGVQVHVQDVLEVDVPAEAEPEERYINTRGATLNYVVWEKSREVYCADKNSPGEL